MRTHARVRVRSRATAEFTLLGPACYGGCRYVMAVHELNCRGLNCPMPIVRLSQAMRGLAVGDHISIEADDPAFRADLEAWVRRFGHQILSFEPGAIQRAVVEKSG